MSDNLPDDIAELIGVGIHKGLRLMDGDDADRAHKAIAGLDSNWAQLVESVAEAVIAKTVSQRHKTFADWLRSRWTPVGAQFNITAADLDRLDEGKAPFGMVE